MNSTGFGRIYSIYDAHLRVCVYVGQTRNQIDFEPHGRLLLTHWYLDSYSTEKYRFTYCIEREWKNIKQKCLDREEVKFILRRSTWIMTSDFGLNVSIGHRRIYPYSKSGHPSKGPDAQKWRESIRRTKSFPDKVQAISDKMRKIRAEASEKDRLDFKQKMSDVVTEMYRTNPQFCKNRLEGIRRKYRKPTAVLR